MAKEKTPIKDSEREFVKNGDLIRRAYCNDKDIEVDYWEDATQVDEFVYDAKTKKPKSYSSYAISGRI